MPDFDFSTLITDRSPADLEALRDLLATPMADWTAEQLAQFNQAVSKGAYNYTDLNRVTACMDYLNERLTALGYVTGYHPIVVHPPRPPEPVGPLPEGYTQLEYIQSSGTQYINTQVIATAELGLEMSGNIGPYSENLAFFGVRSQVSSRDPYANILLALAAGTIRSDYYGSTASVDGSIQGDFTITRNQNQTTVNGFSLTNDTSSASSNRALYLFAVNTNGSATLPASMQLSMCRIYTGGSLIRDYVPCRNPNNVVGLYDLVEGEFYENAGSGAFSAGPEVINPQPNPSPQPDPDLDPYTWYEQDVPSFSVMQSYLSNLNILRSILPLPQNIVDTPTTFENLSFESANDIEEILDVIGIYLAAYLSIFIRSDMTWAVSGGPEFFFTN